MPRVQPAVASLLMAVVHSGLSLVMYTMHASLGEVGVTLLAMAAMTLPAVVAGHLTTARPLVVAIGGVAIIWCVQMLATWFLVGPLTWQAVAFFIQGDIAQGAVACVVCVATFLLRSRTGAKSSATSF